MKLNKHFLTLLLSTSTLICFSQESEIVISEDHLISLIQKIKDKRAANQLEFNKTQELLQNDNSSTTVVAPVKPNLVVQKKGNTVQKLDLNAEKLNAIVLKMNSLENELKYLNSLLLEKEEKVRKQDVVVYQISDKNKAVSADPENIKDDNTDLVLSLQKQIDSLKSSYTRKEVKTVDLVVSPMVPTKNFVAQPTSIRVIRDTIIMKKESSDYLELATKYEGYIQKIYFENDSKDINADQIIGLDQVVTAMQSSVSIDVYLKGFASKKGSVAYNQNLSFLRTESVKRYLVEKGIHPSRILSQYHGVDYDTNEPDSRRVDITFIIRK